MKNKLLVICGPTATGKTKLAAALAKKINGVLVSADSRQVYKFMDIGTGKDKPKGVEIMGYDLVSPDEEYSAAHFEKFAKNAISKIHNAGKLPILVGGTGLYIKAVIDGIETSGVPRNDKLREEIDNFTVHKLQNTLRVLSPERLKSMNSSDANNPRRLVRAIEIATAQTKSTPIKKSDYDFLLIGLKIPRDILQDRITNRVEARINAGFEEEYKHLKSKGYLHAIKKTIGYKDWPDITKWQKEEMKYAKKQMTWFKKDKRINWFDISTPLVLQKIEKLVQTWHNNTYASEN